MRFSATPRDVDLHVGHHRAAKGVQFTHDNIVTKRRPIAEKHAAQIDALYPTEETR